MSTIATITASHGQQSYTVSALQLDRALDDYLPASPHTLRGEVEARTGADWSDVDSLTTLLVVLAAHDAQARMANDPWQ